MFSQILRSKDAIDRALFKSSDLAESLFKQPGRLSDLLTYDEYLPDSKLFIQKDGSVGALFELKLREHEPMTSDQIVRLSKDASVLFNLPSHCTLSTLPQCIYQKSICHKILFLKKHHIVHSTP